MLRLTISVNQQLAKSFDLLIERKGYRNRSEAFRDLLRKALRQDCLAKETTSRCVGCVSFVYDDLQRQLAGRLMDIRQRFASVAVSSTQAPVDEGARMEILIMRGDVESVTKMADSIMAETGVRHGQFNLVPIEIAAH